MRRGHPLSGGGMARTTKLKQIREISTSPPEDGDVLIYSASQGKYVPGPQSSASKSLLNDIVTARGDAQVIVARTTGSVVYV